jgi:hypothetical protein
MRWLKVISLIYNIYKLLQQLQLIVICVSYYTYEDAKFAY